MRKKLIIYLRLSIDDGDDKDESNSISNQRQLIREYIQREKLDQTYEIIELVDDGYSGKNLDRPGMQEALSLIRERQVGMIIVKDFSRMARDYIIMGDFIEKIFPFLGIRFVAINNQYDSDNYGEKLPDMDVSFQNLANDYYSEEKSVKLKAVFHMKRSRGEYIGSVAPYGYKKSQTVKNHLEPDEEAAEIVYRIHCMKFFDGMSPGSIAGILEAEGVLIPSEYLKKKGSKNYFKTGKIKKWNFGMVENILHNEAYLGIVISSKSRVTETGSSKKTAIPRTEWVLSKRSHEAIVPWNMWLANQGSSKEQTTEVMALDASQTGEMPGAGDDYLLNEIAEQAIKRKPKSKIKSGRYILPEELKTSSIKGMVWCANCDHKMCRGLGRKMVYYKCTYHYSDEQGSCMKGGFREDRLLEIVLAAVNQQITLMADLLEIHKKEEKEQQKYQKKCQTDLRKCENKLAVLKRERLELFETYQAGTISKEKYLCKKEKNYAQEEEQKARREALERKLQECDGEELSCLKLYEEKQVVHELTRELAEELIEKIILHSKEQVEIRFKYADEMERLLSRLHCEGEDHEEMKGDEAV